MFSHKAAFAVVVVFSAVCSRRSPDRSLIHFTLHFRGFCDGPNVLKETLKEGLRGQRGCFQVYINLHRFGPVFWQFSCWLDQRTNIWPISSLFKFGPPHNHHNSWFLILCRWTPSNWENWGSGGRQGRKLTGTRRKLLLRLLGPHLHLCSQLSRSLVQDLENLNSPKMQDPADTVKTWSKPSAGKVDQCLTVADLKLLSIQIYKNAQIAISRKRHCWSPKLNSENT